MSDRLEVIPLDDEGDDAGGAHGADAVVPTAPPRRFRGVPRHLVVPVLQLVLLAVVAAALVVIALQERRQTTFSERDECRQSAYNFREGEGEFPAGFELRIEEACGASNPLGR